MLRASGSAPSNGHGHPVRPTLLPQLKALRVLPAVLQQGAATKAAQFVHLSQPAVTRAIAQLEKTCGQPLFIRTSRGMLPTSEGEQLARRAAVLFDLLKTGAQELGASGLAAKLRSHSADRFAQRVTASQLTALVAVAESGSEARAAAQLGITQPAVHAALQALEQLLGVPLFYKLPTGSHLAPPAEPLLLRVKQAMAELRGMDSDIAAWHGEIRGQLVVGVLPLSVSMFLPLALRLLMQQHPYVQVRIVDGTYPALMQHLRSADIDVVAGALRSDVPAAVTQQILFSDDLVIIAHQDHPCLQQHGLQLCDLLRYAWVVPLPDTPADHLLKKIFMHAQLPAPEPRLCANSPAMTQALVQQSGLLAIASGGQARLGGFGSHIRIVPVTLPPTSRGIGIATRASTTASAALRAFAQACQLAVATRSALADRSVPELEPELTWAPVKPSASSAPS